MPDDTLRRSATEPFRTRGAGLGAAALLDLQSKAGNAAVCKMLDRAPPVQRANLMLGEDPPKSASPKEIANQVEIREAADAIYKQHGQAPAWFSTSDLDPPPAKNWVTGHSDGRVIAGRGESYDAAGLAGALHARHLQPNTEIRLIGCSSGAGPGYLAGETAAELAANFGLTGVRIKGATGILIKTTRKDVGGPSGVYRQIEWSLLNRHLTDAFATLLQNIGAQLTAWVAGMAAEDERFLSLCLLEGLADDINRVKSGALDSMAFISAASDAGNPGYVRGLVNPQFQRIRAQLRTRSVQSMEHYFVGLRDALDRLQQSVGRNQGIPTKLDFDNLWETYFRNVQRRTLQWLREESVDPLSRQPVGNLTWVSRGGGQFPRIETKGPQRQRRHSVGL
jgi:hypothetical protein